METIKIDNDFSYLVGLMQTDGSLSETTRNRGKLQIELNEKDEDIIYKISKFIKCNYKIRKRDRITNFGNISTITISVYDLNFRNLIKEWGVPAGKKSKIIAPPLSKPELSTKDYIRGLYDGDGSLGFDVNGYPLVSLTTQSEEIKEFIIRYISELTEKPKKELCRNKRDDIYNIVLYKEDAVTFCKKIYYDNCLSINRKYNNAQKIKKWIRPDGLKKRETQKKWNKEQDNFILSHSIQESMNELNRTKKSVQIRLFRLKKN